ncbi:MAG: hypothetical protein ACM3NN_16750 [Nitrospirota bacterium]
MDSSKGTVVASLRYPVWPLPSETVAITTHVQDSVVILSCLPSGRLNLKVLSRDETTMMEVSSCVVQIDPPVAFKVGFTWVLPSEIEIYARGQHIASLANPQTIPDECRLPYSDKLPKLFDFSKENNLAILKRRDRLAGHQPIPNRERGNLNHLITSLENEIRQIQDLLLLIRAGNLAHAAGLAARLRLLLIEGDPMPLLQLCGAALNEPLTVFTAVFEEPFVTEGERHIVPSRYLDWNLSHVPRENYQNAIDIDVWLTTPAGRENEMLFTHRSLLKAIGDTVGSHVDRDIHPLVPMLRESSSGVVGGTVRDLLVDYIGHIATEITPLLCEIVAKGRNQTARPSN